MPPLAPRPFQQRARRHWRMHAGTWFGYTAFINAVPWYRVQRRRTRLSPNRVVMRHSCEWRNWKKRVLDRRPVICEV